MGKLDGKVALVTGAARGQGRSHALTLAAEGADIIAFDICANIPTNFYDLASQADLDRTAAEVEGLGRRVVATVLDVRDWAAVRAAVDAGVAALGRLDVVVANAGISPLGNPDPASFVDSFDVNLVGISNVMGAALSHVPDGASLIATGSVVAFDGTGTAKRGPGGVGYALAKQLAAQYMSELARVLAPRMIRANVIHPANCNTEMLHSEQVYRAFCPDIEHPTREDAMKAFPRMNTFPIPWSEPSDVSAAVLFLASDDSRLITGAQLRVDAGAFYRFENPTRL
jgi:SDR family mycofactocin-dependent oxidoreductase